MAGFFHKKLTVFLIVGDLLLISIVYYILFSQFPGLVPSLEYNLIATPAIVLTISWIIISAFTKLYRNSYLKEAPEHFSSFTKTFLAFGFFVFIFINLLYSEQDVRSFSLIYLLITAISLSVLRILLFLYRKNYRFRQNKTQKTVLIGDNTYTRKILENHYAADTLGVKGFYSGADSANSKHLGNIDDFVNDLEKGEIETVVFCDDNISKQLYEEIIDIADEKMARVYFVPDFKYLKGDYEVEVINRVPLINMMAEPMSHPENLLLKRIFDVVFSSLVVILVLSWLTPIIALIIKLESKGPVFFIQKRAGLKNETFNCIKFRSMYINNKSDLITTRKGDKRVTNFGRFMRKTSIDELPQFINVLVGDMSVVGPRPHMLSQTDYYAKITKKYMLRHVVKPGITGWAQVMGSRGEIFKHEDMQRRIEKDIFYIKNWSFFLDIKIIFLTFYNTLKGDEQAY